ncbi:MAG: hypothetical protein N3D84_02380, partial [Candidatus Woesearchaeota archaeon]|nr:hypothetical protein [Candidatus Woesearchaeota archaeon]
MENKKRGIVSLVIMMSLFFFLLIPAVFALFAQLPFLSQFAPNIADIYMKYSYFIDSIIYFLILVGAAQVVFEKKFAGRGGKAIIIGVGVSLAIAAAVWEYRSGFMLIKLWPLAMIIFFLAIAMAFYNFLKHITDISRAMALLSMAFLFYFFQALAPGFASWFSANPHSSIRLIWSLLNIVALVCLIWGVIDLFRSIFSGGGESTSHVSEQPSEGPERNEEKTRAKPTTQPTTPHISKPHEMYKELLALREKGMKIGEIISKKLIKITDYIKTDYEKKKNLIKEFYTTYEKNWKEAKKSIEEIKKIVKRDIGLSKEEEAELKKILKEIEEIVKHLGEEEKVKDVLNISYSIIEKTKELDKNLKEQYAFFDKIKDKDVEEIKIEMPSLLVLLEKEEDILK